MEIGTKEVIRTLIKYLDLIHIHIGWITRAINKRKPSENKWGIIVPLLHAVIESCDSIKTLMSSVTNAEKELLPKSRDITIISRSILETTLNIIFILAKGEEASERARKHYLQKSYRNLNRESKVLDQVFKIKLGCEMELEKNEELKKSIEEFTNSRKKEIYTWTPENSLKKLEIIHKKYGKKVSIGIHLPYFYIYPYASEFIHGTFFSAMFNAGLAEPKDPPNSPEDIVKHQRIWITNVITMLLLSIISLTKTISIELPHEGMVKIFEEVTDSYFNEKWMLEFKKERGL